MGSRALTSALLAVALMATACSQSSTDNDTLARPKPSTSTVVESQRQVHTGDPATWSLDPKGEKPSATASKIKVLVTGVICSSGESRPVLPPSVARSEDRVVITFAVEKLPPGNYNCKGIPGSPYTVDLGDPIGNRLLVDGLCLGDGPIVKSAYCVGSQGVRWPLGE